MHALHLCFVLTETTKFSPVIQRAQVSIHVVEIISVRRVQVVIPLFGQRIFAIDSSFRFRFVIHTIKSNTSLQEYMEVGVRARVFGDFVKRLEYVYNMNISTGGRGENNVWANFCLLVITSSKQLSCEVAL